MADPQVIAAGFTNVFREVLPRLMYWLGWFLLIVFIFAFFVAIYILIQYKYKVTVLLRRGRGDDKEHTIGAVSRWERAREIKHQGIPKWKLLIARKLIEPVQSKFVYPGNHTFLYKFTSDQYIPCSWSVANPDVVFTPLPRSIRFWEQLEMQQAARDYAKYGAWEQYGQYFIAMGVIILCLILVGVTVYFTYQHANQVVPALRSLSETIKTSSIIEGIAPG